MAQQGEAVPHVQAGNRGGGEITITMIIYNVIDIILIFDFDMHFMQGNKK